MNLTSRPTVLDLFAGCGGMSLGMEAAGFDVACAVEFDPVHSIVHHFNFPNSATICCDICKVSGQKIILAIKEKGYSYIDVVIGGPPCQGFSHIGKRQLSDKRNKLIFEYVRIVKELQPKYFIFENVPGIASGKHKIFLTDLFREFNLIGYNITSPVKVLDASHFGVAQKRKRLIIIGSRVDVKQARYPIPTHNDINNHLPHLFTHTQPILGASDVIRDLEKYDVFKNDDLGIDNIELVNSNLHCNLGLDPVGIFAKCHRREVTKKIFNHVGSNHSKESITRFKETKPGSFEPISRFFKLHPALPCNTLRAGTNSDRGAYTAPRPIHYLANRCISVREAARLHSFPDWFQFHRTVWHGFREIGNAVAPILAKAVGDEIMEAMEMKQKKLGTLKYKQQDKSLLRYTMTDASRYWNVDRNIIPTRKRIANE